MEPLQELKNLATAFEKVKDCSERTAVITMERDAVTTKYEKLLLSVEQRVGFNNKEIPR